MIQEPDILQFHDSRQYLEAWIVYARDNKRGFSLRKLAGKSGLGAPNYIQMYLQGKRNFRPSTAQAVAVAMDLRAFEIPYFVALVEFTAAQDDEERTVAYRKLLAIEASQGVQTISQAQLAYFEKWYIPAVHTLASLAGFRNDPAWIAQRFYPNIEETEAASALEVLLQLGFFVLGPSGKDGCAGQIEVANPALKTDPRIRSLWVRRYHTAVIERSLFAIETLPPTDRVTSALTVTVPTELETELKDKVDDFRKELFAWLMREQKNKDDIQGEVYQCNFQVFPLTGTSYKT